MRKISLLLIIILLCTSCVAFYGCKDKKAEGETVAPIVQEEEKIEENKIEYTDLKYFEYEKNLEFNGYTIWLTNKMFLPEEISVPPMIDGYPVVFFLAMRKPNETYGALEGVKTLILNEGIKDIDWLPSTTLECVYIPQSLVDNIPYLRDRLVNSTSKEDERIDWYKTMDLNFYLCGKFVDNKNLKCFKHNNIVIDYQKIRLEHDSSFLKYMQ